MTGFVGLSLLFGVFGDEYSGLSSGRALSTDGASATDMMHAMHNINNQGEDYCGPSIANRCCNPHPPDCSYDRPGIFGSWEDSGPNSARRSKDDWKACCEKDGKYDAKMDCAGKCMGEMPEWAESWGGRFKIDEAAGDVLSEAENKQRRWRAALYAQIHGTGKLEDFVTGDTKNADGSANLGVVTAASATAAADSGNSGEGSLEVAESSVGGKALVGGQAIGDGKAQGGTSWKGQVWAGMDKEISTLTNKVMEELSEAKKFAADKEKDLPVALLRWEQLESYLGQFLRRRQKFWDQSQLDTQLMRQAVMRNGQVVVEENQEVMKELYGGIEPAQKIDIKALKDEQTNLWRYFNSTLDKLYYDAEHNSRLMKDHADEVDGKWLQWVNLIDFVATGSTNHAIQEAGEDMNNFARLSTRMLGENRMMLMNIKRATKQEINNLVRASWIGMKKTTKILKKELKVMGKTNTKEAELAGKRFKKEIKSAQKEMKSMAMMLTSTLNRGLKSDVTKPLAILRGANAVNDGKVTLITEKKTKMDADAQELQASLQAYFDKVDDTWKSGRANMESETQGVKMNLETALEKELEKTKYDYLRRQDRSVADTAQLIIQTLGNELLDFNGLTNSGRQLRDQAIHAYMDYNYKLGNVAKSATAMETNGGRIANAKQEVGYLSEAGSDAGTSGLDAILTAHYADFESSLGKILQQSEDNDVRDAERANRLATQDAETAFAQAKLRIPSGAGRLATDVEKLSKGPKFYDTTSDNVEQQLRIDILNDLEGDGAGSINKLQSDLTALNGDGVKAVKGTTNFPGSVTDTRNMIMLADEAVTKTLDDAWTGSSADVDGGIEGKLYTQYENLMHSVDEVHQDHFRGPLQTAYQAAKDNINDNDHEIMGAKKKLRAFYAGSKDAPAGTTMSNSAYAQNAARSAEEDTREAKEEEAKALKVDWEGFVSDQQRSLKADAARAEDVKKQLVIDEEQRTKAVADDGAKQEAVIKADMEGEKKTAVEEKAEIEADATDRLKPPAEAAKDYDIEQYDGLQKNLELMNGNLKAHQKAVMRLTEHTNANRNAMNSMVSRITSQVGAAQQGLQLASIAAEKSLFKQEQALKARSDSMQASIDQLFGGTDAALAGSMNQAIKSSHARMAAGLAASGRTEAQIQVAFEEEERRLKEELANLRGSGQDLITFSDDYAAAVQEQANQAAGTVAAVGSDVQGAATAVDNTMAAVGQDSAAEISVGASQAEELMSAVKHEGRAVDDVYTDIGNQFQSKLKAFEAHALTQNVEESRKVELASRAAADAAEAAANIDEHLRTHATAAGEKLKDMKAQLQTGLATSAEALRDERAGVQSDVEHLQATTGSDVRGLAGRLSASAASFEQALDQAETQIRDKEMAEQKREMDLLKVGQLETEHTIEEAVAVSDEGKLADLDHQGLAAWQHSFAAKNLAWKNIVAKKFSELGVSIYTTELQAAHAEEQEALAAQRAATSEEQKAEDDLSAQERKLQAQITAVYAKADAEIHALMNDASLTDAEKQAKVAEIRKRARDEAAQYSLEAQQMEQRQRALAANLNRYQELVAQAKEAAAKAVAAGHLAPTALAVHEKLESVNSELSKLQLHPWVIPTTVLEVGDPRAALAEENARLKAANARVAEAIQSAEARLAAAKRSPIANAVVG